MSDDVERPTQNKFGTDRAPDGDFSRHSPGIRAALEGITASLHAFVGDARPRPQLPANVREALRRVDDAFAGVRLTEAFDACPHCYTDADITYLRTVPPAEMSESDLASIAFSFISTIGGPDDIAYFVPALIRAQLCGAVIEDAMIMKLLARLPPPHWTAERRDALRAAYEEYFAWIPVNEEYGVDLTEPGYRMWIRAMLDREPHGEPFVDPIPGWDR